MNDLDVTPILTPDSTETAPGPADWWVATDRLADGGQKIIGPFATRQLALDVRWYVEQVNAPATYWVDSDAEPE